MLARQLLALLLLVLLTGCIPSSPDATAWTDQARRTVDSVASEVASTTLVLDREQHDGLLGKTAVVMAVDSEKASGSSVESFSSAQPPPGRHERYDDVLDVLDDATDLLTKARIAVVDDRSGSYPGLRHELEDMHMRLSELSAELG